jgi:primosomal protein N' (replication factor Y)
MSAGDRFENWTRARTGQARVVVGARSAVWAPLPNLGLIVVDEEHDHSYKQNENIPRYHARDVAVYRGYLNNSLVVLGSASPSVESYTNALNGKYVLVRMKERYGPAQLPRVEVVDMRNEHAAGNWSSISTVLEGAIRSRLENKEQAILLLNRRGFAPVLLCKSCGEMARCPHCDVTTTFHSDGRVHCHY